MTDPLESWHQEQASWSACSAGDPGLIPGSGRSPGEGNGNPLQSSCRENPMDRRAWRTTIDGVAKSQTQLSKLPSDTAGQRNTSCKFRLLAALLTNWRQLLGVLVRSTDHQGTLLHAPSTENILPSRKASSEDTDRQRETGTILRKKKISCIFTRDAIPKNLAPQIFHPTKSHTEGEKKNSYHLCFLWILQTERRGGRRLPLFFRFFWLV